jgi:hypothetical protein
VSRSSPRGEATKDSITKVVAHEQMTAGKDRHFLHVVWGYLGSPRGSPAAMARSTGVALQVRILPA